MNAPKNVVVATTTLFESGQGEKNQSPTRTTPQSIAVAALVRFGFSPADASKQVAEAGAKQVHIAIANAEYYAERGNVHNLRGMIARGIRDRHPLTDGLRQARKVKQADAKRVAEALRRQAQAEQQQAAARDRREAEAAERERQRKETADFIAGLSDAEFNAAAQAVVAKMPFLRPGPGVAWRQSRTLGLAVKAHLTRQQAPTPAGVPA